MKLKPILASLMLLGLAAPAFADAPATASASTQSQIDAMKAQLNKMEAIVNQNSAGGFQQAADWTSRITVSGLLNVDAYASNTTANFGIPAYVGSQSVTLDNETGEVVGTSSNVRKNVDGHTSNLAVNNANLFVDALVNDWTNVHIGLQYNSGVRAEFSRESAYSRPTFDEGYVTLANFSESPIFFRAGREYLPFGVYNRFPMVQNPTQLLSETSGNAAQVGFVSPVGVYGSVYGFRGLAKDSDPANRPRVNNWGADLGYAYSNAMYGMKLDAGYINNFNDVNYVSTSNGLANGYSNRVGGVALSADGNVGPFDASLRYVTALQSSQNYAIYTASGAKNAKPSAWGAELGYSFPIMAHQSRVALGYQHTYNSAAGNVATISNSTDTANNTTTFTATDNGVSNNTGVGEFGLPLSRYYANYTVNVSKWTDIGLEVYHDRDYGITHGGTGSSATVGVLQLGVKFA